MPFPTITEKYGSLSATGFSKEQTFGTPVAASTFLPMVSNTMEEDPGWFSPELMQNVRDLHIYNLYGEAKYQGAITGPIFPSNAMETVSASIGADGAVGYGVAAATPVTPTSTTTNGSLTAGTSTVVLTSGTGFLAGQQVAIDTGTNQEIRRIASVSTNTLTLSDPLLSSHLTGVAAVTGSTTTLNGATSANATTVVVTSATGIVNGSFIQIDVNSPSGSFTSEIRKVTNVATNTLTLDVALVYAHANASVVTLVTTPYTHTFIEQNTLPSLTVEKNIGGFQSLQFAGCRVNKWDLKAPVGNTAVEMTLDMIGRSVAVLDTPTAVTVANELPYVFAEANLTMYGTLRTEVSNVGITVENGIKETYTYSNQHGPSFITPVTLHANGVIDLVFSSLDDSTYGDFNRMANGTLGALQFSLVHPTNGGTIIINMPQVALNKFANNLKMTDVVMTSLNYEATRPLSGNSQFTIQATVVNSIYTAY